MTPFVNTEESIQSDAPKTFKNVECPSQFPELLELEKEIFGPLPIEVLKFIPSHQNDYTQRIKGSKYLFKY
jgi:hypothetical protein